MNKKTLIGIIATVLLVLLLVGGVASYGSLAPNTGSQSGTSSSAVNDPEVRVAVEGFGAAMQKVSLLAPTAERKAAMEQNYSAFVAPELLAAWALDGADALGRSTSSPWPDRIQIVEMHEQGAAFVVEGNVIEVVNTTSSTTAPVAVYPVTLTLEKINGQWMITKATKGAYSELPHSQTIIGYWECLPHKDTTGPQTAECAFGIAKDQSDGHYAVDTSLMARYPVDYPTGTKVRITGIVTPADQLNSPQKYDIDGIIRATAIEKI